MESASGALALSQVARRVGGSHPAVLKSLERLARQGLVSRDGSRWRAAKPLLSPTEATREPQEAPQGWDAVRALCHYYAECLELEAGGQARLSPGDVDSASVALGTRLDWSALARGRAVKVPASTAISQLLAQSSGNRLRLAGPLELRAGRGAAGPTLYPVFLMSVVATRRAGGVELRPDSGLRVNEAWIRERFRGPRSDGLADTLIHLGFYDEELLRPGESPELVAREGMRFDEAWSAALELFRHEVREPGDAKRVATEPPLSRLRTSGFYNRLLLLPAVSSNYHDGAMSELRRIAERPDAELERTALAPFFGSLVNAKAVSSSGATSARPEFRPLNAEQRLVVEHALTRRLIAVQGPPGTGKSVTVLHTMAAQALNGRATLFASRNHRALEAVVPRLQAIDEDHPLILRLTKGASDDAGEGDDWIRALMQIASRHVSDEAKLSLNEARTRLDEALQLRARAESELKAHAVTAAEMAEAYEAIRDTEDVIDQRLLDAVGLSGVRVAQIEEVAHRLRRASDGLLGRAIAWWGRYSLSRAMRGSSSTLPQSSSEAAAVASMLARWARARDSLHGLEARSIDQEQRERLVARLESADEGVRACTREALVAFARAMGGGLADDLVASIANLKGEVGRRSIARALHRERASILSLVDQIFKSAIEIVPLWACSSLSVRSRLPFVAGAFDLVIIDEASQCDIPSSIPLLFRARRAMIVGDPQQLQHVAHVGREAEDRIRERHRVADERFGAYLHSTNSVWSPAAVNARRAGGATHLLREHWRCHPAIADYVSKLFYGDQLRVRTQIEQSPPVVRGQRRLRGIEWTDVPGGSEVVPGGSRFWQPQVDAIVSELERVASTGFDGTVGVVTPFRAQADRIRDAVARRLPAGQLKGWRFESQTADGFQGDERDLVLLGLVGGPDPNDVPNFYARDRNRFNVAVSRARGLLHVFGDQQWAATCGLDTLESLVRAWKSWREKESQPVRADLIGPVWEPRFAGALRAAGVEYFQQYPACGFYLDFALLREGKKLAVEVDGETYHRDAQGNLRIEDVRRDQMLRAAGWSVLRFWVYELKDDMEACVERVKDAFRDN